MPRRRFRWDPEKREMVELTTTDTDAMHFVRGEIPAFVAQDGTYIDSRAKYEDYCARNNVVPWEQGINTKEYDRYAQDRQNQSLREHLWEQVDRAMHQRRR